MRNLVSCFCILLLTFGLAVNEASAKRFGGGRSFGVQRSHSSSYFSPSTAGTKASSQKPNVGRWGGILGGVLAGGFLASLFAGHGFGSGIFSWLMVGIAIYSLWFLRKKMQLVQPANSNTYRENSFKPAEVAPPAGFAAEEFLREAKIMFIRLQTAYDQKNLQDLTDFTAPEVFAEIKMQLDERGNEANHTEVKQLEARLLDASNQAGSMMASVNFSGQLIENSVSEPLNEIWHFRKFAGKDSWVVGGIQQA